MALGREIRCKLKSTWYMGLLQIVNNNQEIFATFVDNKQQQKNFSGNYI
jgi:hypothetical protein